MFGVTILGNNSALPAYDRHPTSQVVTLGNKLFLVDCGEGTQMQLLRYKVKWSRIQYIFISHLHGDHYFGLPGLLNSMGLLNRETEVHLFAPPELESILNAQFAAAGTVLPYPLHFHPLTKAEVLIEDSRFRVSCFPTIHRIACWGFRFEEVKPPRKILPEKAALYNVPAEFFEKLKSGKDYIAEDGRKVQNHLVTEEAPPPRSYAYCADTKFDLSLVEHIQNADLLFHETTYLAGMEERADARFHATTFQAAEMARLAKVKRLIIGHFSSKYEFLDVFQDEARTIFPDTEIALEGCTFRVGA